MANQDRAAAHALMEALRREPWRFDFFQAMRLVECRHPGKPRLGTSVKPGDDPVRLAQAVSLEFPPAALAAWEPGRDGRPDRLVAHFLGLFGPQGPLPLHLTEYAYERVHHHGNHTFHRFADIFHHRMLCLFYRAWADPRPTVQHDRPERDRFANYLGSLFGIGMPGLRGRDAMPDAAKLLFAGHLSCQARHADGLRAVIAEFFGVPTRIVEFVGEWMDIAPGEQTRLGAGGQAGQLGVSTVAGARVFGCQHKIRVELGPLDIRQYRAFLPLPGRPGLDEPSPPLPPDPAEWALALDRESSLGGLKAIVRNYVGEELAWDLRLILRKEQVPALRLDGQSQLGWTSWLGGRDGDAGDLTLNPRPGP